MGWLFLIADYTTLATSYAEINKAQLHDDLRGLFGRYGDALGGVMGSIMYRDDQ